MLDLTDNLLVWVVILALATFRLAWLLAREAGPFNILERFREWLGRQVQNGKQDWHWSLAELFHCPLCLGVWIGLLLLLVAMSIRNIVVSVVMLWLAIAGLQSFLTLLLLKEEQNDD